MKIFTAKLPYSFQEEDIKGLFTPYGEVGSVKLIMDRETGRSKGYAFIEMPNQDEATNAITNLDQKSIGGKNIAVSEAKEKENTGGNSFQRGTPRSNNFQQRRSYGNYNEESSYNERPRNNNYREKNNFKRNSEY